MNDRLEGRHETEGKPSHWLSMKTGRFEIHDSESVSKSERMADLKAAMKHRVEAYYLVDVENRPFRDSRCIVSSMSERMAGVKADKERPERKQLTGNHSFDSL